MDALNPGTALICGFLQIDRTARQLLMSALPAFLVIKAEKHASSAQVVSLLDLMFAEARNAHLAAVAILDRLADALLFYVIRDLAQCNLPTPGLLGAFGDSHVQRAVLAISADPGRRWTVESLAQQALLSRSVFAERFYRCCGVSPIDFLTIWRMHLARGWLEQERATVLDVAERCGYESPAAFSKAFKRLMGVGPGQFRKIGAIRSGL
jgi:AraC-like DNA-binding protein